MKKFWVVLSLLLTLAIVPLSFGQSMETPTKLVPSVEAVLNNSIFGGVGVYNVYHFECYDKDGNFKWAEDVKNKVVTAGLNSLLRVMFGSGTQSVSWFIGLIGSTGLVGFADSDTMASHAAWTEISGYTTGAGAVRPQLVLGAVSGGAADNSASVARFSMTGTTTAYGAFIVDGYTFAGAGILGLYGEGAFSTARAVVNLDTLNVTITLTVTASDALDILFEFLDHIALWREPILGFKLAS